jgi:hypothetical protein
MTGISGSGKGWGRKASRDHGSMSRGFASERGGRDAPIIKGPTFNGGR